MQVTVSRNGVQELLTVQEVADLLGVECSTVRAYAARGQMPDPDRRYGRTPLWARETITDWMATRNPR